MIKLTLSLEVLEYVVDCGCVRIQLSVSVGGGFVGKAIDLDETHGVTCFQVP